MSEDNRQRASEALSMHLVLDIVGKQEDGATMHYLKRAFTAAYKVVPERLKLQPYFENGDLESYVDYCEDQELLIKVDGKYMLEEPLGERERDTEGAYFGQWLERNGQQFYELKQTLDEAIATCYKQKPEYEGQVMDITDNVVFARVFPIDQPSQEIEKELPRDKFPPDVKPGMAFFYNNDTGAVSLNANSDSEFGLY